MYFTELLKKALRLLGAKKCIEDIKHIDKRRNRIEKLVNKCKKKSRIRSLAKYFMPLPEPAFQPLVAPAMSILCGNSYNNSAGSSGN